MGPQLPFAPQEMRRYLCVSSPPLLPPSGTLHVFTRNFILHPLPCISYLWGVLDECVRDKGSTGPLIASLRQFSLLPPVPQDYSFLCTDFGETCCCLTTDPKPAHCSRELSAAEGLLDHSSGVPGGSGGRATLPSQRSTLNV